MKYIANPVNVEAFKIVSCGPTIEGTGMHLALEDGSNVIATMEMLARIAPQVGDYWVIQSDGYVYLNPKDVFERKYRPAPEQATSA